jgi:hypothetical protein
VRRAGCWLQGRYGETLSTPERHVCRDLEAVVRIVKYVYYFGEYAPGVGWES